MKLSAQMTFWISLAFATFCIVYGVNGYLSLQDMPAGAERDDAKGFVWFFLFMGSIGIVTTVVSWLMIKGRIAYPSE